MFWNDVLGENGSGGICSGDSIEDNIWFIDFFILLGLSCWFEKILFFKLVLNLGVGRSSEQLKHGIRDSFN